MNPIRRVVICGTSVFLMSIEAGLTNKSGMEVVRLNHRLPNAKTRIMALSPDVVIVERGDTRADQARALLSHGLSVVELDASRDTVTVLSGLQFQVSETQDLARLIKEITSDAP